MKEATTFTIEFTSDDRKRLYDENFKILSTRKKILVIALLMFIMVVSIWLIMRRTGLFYTRKLDPTRIFGIVFLLFSIIALAILIGMDVRMHKITSKLTPASGFKLSIERNQLTFNELKIDKDDIKEIFTNKSFLFFSISYQGNTDYILLPLKNDNIMNALKQHGYEVKSLSTDFPLWWKR